MTESDFTRRLMHNIKDVGGLVMPIVAHRRGEPGWPDRLVVHTRWTGFVEVKVDDRQVTALQKIRIRDIRARMHNGAVVVRRAQSASGVFYYQIEDERGERLALFDGTGLGLLLELEKLKRADR